MWIIREDNVHGRAFMTVIVLLLVLAYTSVCLRLWTRKITRSMIDAGDMLCIASLISETGLAVVIWAAFAHGWGLDITQFTLEDAKMAGKLLPSILIVWNTSVCLIRVSMLVFYLQLFRVTRWRYVFWVFVGLNFASLVAIIFSTLLICRPITYSFDKSAVGGHCGDLISFQLFVAIWNLLMDVAIVVLPMPVIWGLKMKIKSKVGVSLMFGMGFVICLVTLARILIGQYYEVNNLTRQNGVVVFLTGIEATTGITNACLPHFPPAFKRLQSTKFGLKLSKVFNITISRDTKNSEGQQINLSKHTIGSSKKRNVQDSDFERLSDTDGSEFAELTSFAR